MEGDAADISNEDKNVSRSFGLLVLMQRETRTKDQMETVE